MPPSVTILAIESSCDETAAAVMSDGKLLSNIIASQTEHLLHGGVVPEMAGRAHLQKIIFVVTEALTKASVSKSDLTAIAFTQSPGLIGSLMVGSSFAKAMALSLNIPLIAVHHLQAHVMAHFIEEPHPSFPFICLTVSGGHTQLVLVKDFLVPEILGESIDDAAGEAFDKTAKLLGLPYPGGPLIDQYAQQGNPYAFYFPEPAVAGHDFSFSGLKTAIRYFLKEKIRTNQHFIEENICDICASVQNIIVKTLLNKLEAAASQTGIVQIGIAGGVAANSGLRKEAKNLAQRNGWKLFIPSIEFCTDNAAMIAITSHHKFLKKDWSELSVTPSARTMQ